MNENDRESPDSSSWEKQDSKKKLGVDLTDSEVWCQVKLVQK